jgi:uncharacterized RDD family membrane protein YckC
MRWTAHQPAAPAVSGPTAADWGKRVPAFLIDIALVVPGFVFTFFAWFHEVNRVIDEAGDNGTAPLPRIGVFFLGWFMSVLAVLLNRGVAQGLTGRSLGKKIMKVRVVRIADGTPPGLGWGLLRLAIEMIAGWIDIIIAFVTDRHQRLGDMAAKTLVVDEAVAQELRGRRSVDSPGTT